MEKKKRFNPISYIVDCNEMSYKYALHSTKRDRILFPSQILNVLEYCLFKKVKADEIDKFDKDSFKFDIIKLYDGVEVDKWDDKEKFMEALWDSLYEYYKNLTASRKDFVNED